MALVKNILLAEDRDDDVFLFRRSLRRAGVSSALHVFEDGRPALDYLGGAGPYADRLVHPMPELVILDIKMPFVSGFDVLRWISLHRDILSLVVVMLSSSGEIRDRNTARELGAHLFAIKPPGPELFVELAKQCDLQWPGEGLK
jgi:DNA-binding response OmpR family regulator